MFLFGVLAVGVYIGDIVEQIHRAGCETEEQEAFECSGERFDLKQLFVEDQGKKDKAVLCPLTQAHGFYQGSKHESILPF